MVKKKNKEGRKEANTDWLSTMSVIMLGILMYVFQFSLHRNSVTELLPLFLQ